MSTVQNILNVSCGISKFIRKKQWWFWLYFHVFFFIFRYNKRLGSSNKPHPDGFATRDQILRKQRSVDGRPFSSSRSDTSEGAFSNRSSGPTDMDRWLDNVFDPILDGDLDELSDGRSLENRMRGGGEGVPGVAQVI